LDGSFIEWSIQSIRPDQWRPRGVQYRLAWVQKKVCRVLFDNHHGKTNHKHIDGVEHPYTYISTAQLRQNFKNEIRKLGGPV